MINHISLIVNDFEKSKEFFSKALAPLGYRLLTNHEDKKIAGFGIEDKDGQRDFWIKEKQNQIKQHSFSCLAFSASSKKMVNKYYEEALKAGGTDNGTPGYRKKYYDGYYAAYVLDLDGHNIEVVFDDPNPSE